MDVVPKYHISDFTLFARLGYGFGESVWTPMTGFEETYDIDGFRYGVGASYSLFDDWELGFDYTINDFDSSSKSGPDTYKTSSALITLNYNFN